ncbi:DUF1684 domain-containing protein [Rhodococcus sp. IEGM 1379]|uniref:DUF1684 domain-containing protein n=1 Tax=Rhodococcus sp. IEGM 1379 TaxID=3047086 RepID=UPI0024B691B0|nr:DUF1684 domain-containing protein [Rhodococcus sp. IEGM 1379]MDI9916147.1 DUF1684 domain-containing protein [Rhodococcus sp. IEGM 1379]
MTVTETDIPSDIFVSDWNAWHTLRDKTFSEPLGWLSLTALHWLVDVDSTFPDLPGTWRADQDAVIITAELSDDLSVDGFAVDGSATLTPVEGAPGLIVKHGPRLVEVIRRTGNVALRIHDSSAPALVQFSGIPTFAPRSEWIIEGVFTAFPQARTVTTGAVVPGLEHHHDARGTINFEYDGSTRELIAFAGRDDGFHVLFTDTTSGVSTYPAARSLHVSAPVPGGAVVLDFNRASNLPCAFTDYATCPVAPAENRLPFAVDAGEKTPEGRSGRALS